MKSDTTFDIGPPEEAHALLATLAHAIEAGSMETFMTALGGGENSGAIHWKVARAIPAGYRINEGRSVAELCLEHGRPEMLIAAVHSQWPESADDTIRGPADRLRTLSTCFSYGEFSFTNLAHRAAFERWPQSLAFIEFGFELGLDDQVIEMLEAQDAEAAALIRAARMNVSIRNQSMPATTEVQSSPRRRNRLV
jgi:hypothetical protein